MTSNTTVKRPYPRVRTPVIGESMTQQHFKEEADVNNIMTKYLTKQITPVLNPAQPMYGMASSLSFREAMDVVQNMTQNFDELPSEVQKKFGHNPAEFLAFVENPENQQQCIDLGLMVVPEGTPEEKANMLLERIAEALKPINEPDPTAGGSGS